MNFKEVECGLVSLNSGLLLVTSFWESSGCIETRDFLVFPQQVFRYIAFIHWY